MMLGWLCRAWPPVFSEQGLMLMMRGLLCWEKSVGPGVFASGADAHDAGLVVSVVSACVFLRKRGCFLHA